MYDSDLAVYACCRVSAAAAVVPSAFIALLVVLGRDVLLNIEQNSYSSVCGVDEPAVGERG